MIINQQGIIQETTEKTVKIFQGVRRDIEGVLEMIHVDKDAWMIEIVNNTSEEGYISIQRAPATAGEPSFTELFQFDKDGYFYLGNKDTNGTVRLRNNAGVFEVAVREAGTYNFKGGFG